MKTEELIARVNARVPRGYGITFTQPALENWVREGVVLGPVGRGLGQGKGVDWQWSEQSLRQAVRVCWLKAQQVNRFEALRAELWLRGLLEIPLHHRQKDFTSEFRRSRRRSLRPRPDKSSIAPQLGQLLRRLRDFMICGETNAPVYELTSIIALAVGLESTPSTRRELSTLICGVIDQVLVEPSDALELHNDHSAESMIAEATQQQWEYARAFVQQTPWMCSKGHKLMLLALGKQPSSCGFDERLKLMARAIMSYHLRLRLFVPILAALARKASLPDAMLVLPPAISHVRSLLAATSGYRGSDHDEFRSDPQAEIALLLRPFSSLSPPEGKARAVVTHRLRHHGLAELEGLIRKAIPKGA